MQMISFPDTICRRFLKNGDRYVSIHDATEIGQLKIDSANYIENGRLLTRARKLMNTLKR